jgi:GNAT superfamily N-acetyltransferase
MGREVMGSLIIRDMQANDEYFVGSCSHAKESDKLDIYAQRRISWLNKKYDNGVRAKVALADGKRVGFLFVMPIEVCPIEPLGTELMSIPCLFVSYKPTGSGVGRALLSAAEKEARLQGKPGIATVGNYTGFWFRHSWGRSLFRRSEKYEAIRRFLRIVEWSAVISGD